ncbi:myosin-2 heavy chain-like [Actinia tenebrosa]|uniref:Myosin-2 heavy chain-like n=1 Tax=Actinia tenebrosa TaxID=6105 RepID=A0A6P8IX22_ACTTE|nr:myosin-2 heavy chain-like [Actinia tenebrosa]
MEVEGTDFDPLTEEGQVDINDEEFDAWTKGEETDPLIFDEALREKYGSRWKRFKASLARMWRSKKPSTPIPTYLQMEDLGPVPEPPTQTWAEMVTMRMDESLEENVAPDFDRLTELLPDWDHTKAQLEFDDSNQWGKEIIIGRLSKAGSKIYVIRDERGRYFTDPKIPPTLKKAIGEPNLVVQQGLSQEETKAAVSRFLNRAVTKLPAAAGGQMETVADLRTQLGKQNEWLQAKNEEIARLNSTQREMNAKMRKMQSEPNPTILAEQAIHRVKLKEMRDEIAEIARQKKAAENALNRITAERDDLLKANADEAALRAAFQELEAENQYLKERIEELEGEYADQNEATTKSHAAQVADFRQRLSNLLSKKTTAENDFRSAMSRLAGKDTELTRMGEEVVESHARERRIMAQMAEKDLQIGQLQETIEDLQGQIERQQEVVADQTQKTGEETQGDRCLIGCLPQEARENDK